MHFLIILAITALRREFLVGFKITWDKFILKKTLSNKINIYDPKRVAYDETWVDAEHNILLKEIIYGLSKLK